MASRAKEDYLKAIYECEESNGIAKTTHLADKLGVRAATVTEMIQRLSQEPRSAIIYKHHQGVHLTPDGKKQALNIVRRHRLLETFLHETLKLNWDEVHQEAEVLEHHLSPRVTAAIDRHLGFPKFDPHGEPIPDESGRMAPHSLFPLSQVKEKGKFTITGVDPISGEFLAHLQQQGIGIGTTGRLLSREPDTGALRLQLGSNTDAHTTLTEDISNRIFVERR